jgi:hypothetical protein
MSSASKLLSQTNEIIKNLERLKSNVDLYEEVHSLQKNLNTLEETYNSLQNNLKTSECNAQCESLNTTKDPHSIDDFLINLLLLKSKSKSPITQENGNNVVGQIANIDIASAPPEELLDDDEM